MTSQTMQQSEGLTFVAYPGDGTVLLAFDVDQGMEQDLAGFAVEYTDPDGQTLPVLNRLGFAQPITSATTPSTARPARPAMTRARRATRRLSRDRSTRWRSAAPMRSSPKASRSA